MELKTTFIGAGHERIKKLTTKWRTQLKEDFWLIREDAPLAEVWSGSEMGEPQFKGITTITITHSMSDGFVKNVTTNGIDTIRPRQEGREMKANASILSAEAFRSHAKTLALQELERDWKESEAVFSLKSSDLQVSFDPDSFSWKTSQLSLFGGLTEFVWSSLRWGMIVDGRLFQPPALEPVTDAKDGSCLPMIPTASASDSIRGPGAVYDPSSKRQSDRTLTTFAIKAMLPTPTASLEGSNCSPNSTNKRLGLSQLARKGQLPTPCARDWKDSGMEPSAKNRNSLPLASTVGGSLNPQFVEELMGYKIGWTDLDALEIAWFHSKLEKRLKNCQE
jgi:hypothetical protein